MFTVTPQAAKEILHSVERGAMQGLWLRIAAQRNPDGSIDYQMGFDEFHEGDVQLTSEGIDLTIGHGDKELLNGAVLDYVEIEPGEFRFIFLNPNDPAFVPPKED
jgi:iron-sulfur cluster assembly protein